MKTLYPIVSQNSWSYIVNDKGNGFAMTIEGYGSCTPTKVIQDMINKMDKKNWDDMYERCDKAGKANLI